METGVSQEIWDRCIAKISGEHERRSIWDEDGSFRPWLSSLWLFLPLKDELAVPLEGAKARLKGSQHGYRDLGVATFLKRSCNTFTLASDAFLAFDDEAFNLR